MSGSDLQCAGRPALGGALDPARATFIQHRPMRVANGAMCTAYHNRHGEFAIARPYTSDKRWRALRYEHPEQRAEAVAFDRAIRSGSARATANVVPLRGQAYPHPSPKPLDEAP